MYVLSSQQISVHIFLVTPIAHRLTPTLCISLYVYALVCLYIDSLWHGTLARTLSLINYPRSRIAPIVSERMKLTFRSIVSRVVFALSRQVITRPKRTIVHTLAAQHHLVAKTTFYVKQSGRKVNRRRVTFRTVWQTFQLFIENYFLHYFSYTFLMICRLMN